MRKDPDPYKRFERDERVRIYLEVERPSWREAAGFVLLIVVSVIAWGLAIYYAVGCAIG